MQHAHAKDALLTRMTKTIARHGLLAPGERTLAAVSGGADSMVMLHALQRLGYAVEAAHFDHQTRNGASATDAAYVRETCAQMGIPYHEGGESVEADARNAGCSFEAYARERRYAFLLNTAEQTGCPVIATAHHEDDQAETLLMGMLGMTSGFGVTGIAPCLKRSSVKIVRPMLDCNRDEIELWARENGVSWRNDLTNREPHCARNRVRLELLPALEAHSPRARRVLARLADVLRVDGAYLDALAEQTLTACIAETAEGVTWNRHSFLETPESLQRHALKLLARRLGVAIGYERITAAAQFIAEAATGKQFDFGGGVILYSAGNAIRIYPAGQYPSVETLPRTHLNVPGETRVANYVFQTRLTSSAALPEGGARAYCLPTRQCFDADKLSNEGTDPQKGPVPELYVRSRQPGDRMMPLGMEHARKVQDIMIDLHIPAYQRDMTPLLLQGENILWIAGYVRSSIAPVDDTTTTLLHIELSPR